MSSLSVRFLKNRTNSGPATMDASSASAAKRPFREFLILRSAAASKRPFRKLLIPRSSAAAASACSCRLPLQESFYVPSVFLSSSSAIRALRKMCTKIRLASPLSDRQTLIFTATNQNCSSICRENATKSGFRMSRMMRLRCGRAEI